MSTESYQAVSDVGVRVLLVARDGIRLEVVGLRAMADADTIRSLPLPKEPPPFRRVWIQAASPPPPRVDGRPWDEAYGGDAASSSPYDGLAKLSLPAPTTIVLNQQLALSLQRGMQIEVTRPDPGDPMGFPANGYPQPTEPVDVDFRGEYELGWMRPLSPDAWVALSFDRFDPDALSTALIARVTDTWLFDPPTERPPPPSSPPAIRVGSLQGAGNDRVAPQDQLNFKDYVDAFAELIRSSDTKPPLTIGIFGSWGMGKSFLLEHIERNIRGMQGDPQDDDGKATKRQWRQARRRRRKELRRRRREARAAKAANRSPKKYPHCHVYIVSFNAWEYSATEVIWPGLVRKIMDRLEVEVSRNVVEQLARRLFRNLRRQVKQHRSKLLATGAIVPVLVAIALWRLRSDIVVFGGIGLALGAALVKAVGEGLSKPLSQWVTTLFEERDYGKQIGYMAEIREDLMSLVHRLKEDGGRILITIDDLDRCEPEKSVEVLQAINLLLNFDSFIVCLGIDARVTTRAVEKYYEDLLKPTGASGYEYLDKVVQIPFRIPKPTEKDISSFIAKVMSDQPPPPPPGRTKTPVGSVRTGRAADGPAGQPEGSSKRQGDTGSPVDFTRDEQAAFQNLSPFFRRNPRHLKRLVNIYRLVRTLAVFRGQDFVEQDPTLAVRLLVMCGQWPYTTFEMLRRLDSLLDDKTKLNGKTAYERATQEAQKLSRDPLTYLFEKVAPELSEEKQGALDDDVELLKRLLAQQEGRPTWEQLITLRRYTINFNPAVEAEIVPSREEERQREEGRTTTVASGRTASPSSTTVQAAPTRRAARTAQRGRSRTPSERSGHQVEERVEPH